jgi:hypothetical protein
MRWTYSDVGPVPESIQEELLEKDIGDACGFNEILKIRADYW